MASGFRRYIETDFTAMEKIGENSRRKAEPFCGISTLLVNKAYTLKRNNITSPSLTRYSFPSWRTFPASFAAAIEPASTRSS